MGETSYNEEDAKKFEWELCRENVKPMKHGRRVDAINKALSKVECNAERVASEKLEECFATAESAEDPLELCLGFCRWFVDSYPSGKQRLYYQLLWKIVHKFIEKSRYEHDPRSLKIWESLADNSLGHGYEVYQYAYHKGCLTENADFYIRWARDLEDRGAIQNAREVLHRGRLQGAMPLNILVDEEDQLEMREMRRQLDRVKTSDDQESDDDWDNDENGETRQVFTRMSSLDDGAVPVMRLPSLVGEQGSRKLADVPKSQLQSTAFDVFEDDEKAQENYLEDIYQIHSEAHSSHIERYALKNNNTIKLAPTKNPKKTHSQSTSSFAIWSDDKENVDPNDEVGGRPSASKGLQKKPKLAFQKKFLEVAMEEIMAERYFADEAVRKRLTFDDTDED